MTVLCVVDMQAHFTTSSACLDGVVKEVEAAMEKQIPVVVLEYAGCGQTISDIQKLLNHYDMKAYAKKCRDGGGDIFLEKVETAGWNPDTVRFVGVNRSFCVYSTIHEVKQKLEDSCNIQVITDATWCSYPDEGLVRLANLGEII